MICPNCNKSVVDGSTFCPHCDHNFRVMPKVQQQSNSLPKSNITPTSKTKKILTTIALFALVFFVIIPIKNSFEEAAPKDEKAQTQKTVVTEQEKVEFEPIQINDDFMLLECEVNKSLLSFTISGIVESISDKDFSFVSISFALYDKDGNKLEEISDNLSGLKAGETWKFEVIGTAEADSAKISDFKAF